MILAMSEYFYLCMLSYNKVYFIMTCLFSTKNKKLIDDGKEDGEYIITICCNSVTNVGTSWRNMYNIKRLHAERHIY